MTPTEIVDLVRVVAWPVVSLVALVVLRRQLPLLLRRTKKIGLAGLEIEFEAATEFSPKWSIPGLGDVRHAHATAAIEFSSHATSLMEQFDGDGCYDYAVVNLGQDRSWLTSRLYIFSIMLRRMRGLQCWVFLRPDEGARSVYLGLASADEVRWALARRFPWLETAYAQASGKLDPHQVTSDRGALEHWQATELVQHFLTGIQTPEPPPAGMESQWIPLTESGPWERAEWLSRESLASVLGGALRPASIFAELRALTATDRAKLLQVPGDFVALVGDGWTFNGVVDRRAALEKIGARLADAVHDDA